MSATLAQHPLFDALPSASPTVRTLRLVESPHKPVRESSPPWLVDAAPTSRAKKSGAFLLVVLGHLAFFAIFATVRSSPPPAALAPAQVVIVSEHHSALDLPKPPPPQLETPQFDVPLVPIVVESIVADNSAITVAQRPPEQSVTANVGTPKEVSSVEYIREPAAKYPSAARALKQRGTVMLRALIDVEGRAREVKVHRSSGFKLLDDAARNAVFTAIFKPYAENGRSIRVYVLIPIEFGAS
jgi:protein TonB